MEYLNIILSETYKILFLLVPVLVSVAMIVWLDRRIWAFVQKRQGPNVVGPFGLLQSLADALKYIFKEVIIPSSSNKVIFILAPIVTMTLALISWAVIPFSATQVLADINVGILYLFAVSSLGVYGIIMGGWASNSKYPFLGAIRSAAQMVSYEVSIGVIIINVLLCVGSLNLNDIVMAQENLWFVIPLFPMFVIFFISALAETNRPPFDLPEAEAELVAGYQTEYSGMMYAMFWLGEYANILLMCAMGSILFLGAIRSAAQMVSYEVSIGVIIINVLLCVGSLNLNDIVMAQENLWFVIPLFPMFVIFFISALAETNRPPFDLPEAEAELVAGYQTEYSGMMYAMFWLGEYANILLMCAMGSILFLGGWLSPIELYPFNLIPGAIWLIIKILLLFILFALVKAIVPRYRYDQLMRLGWKVFLPMSLTWVVLTASYLFYFNLLPIN